MKASVASPKQRTEFTLPSVLAASAALWNHLQTTDPRFAPEEGFLTRRREVWEEKVKDSDLGQEVSARMTGPGRAYRKAGVSTWLGAHWTLIMVGRQPGPAGWAQEWREEKNAALFTQLFGSESTLQQDFSPNLYLLHCTSHHFYTQTEGSHPAWKEPLPSRTAIKVWAACDPGVSGDRG